MINKILCKVKWNKVFRRCQSSGILFRKDGGKSLARTIGSFFDWMSSKEWKNIDRFVAPQVLYTWAALSDESVARYNSFIIACLHASICRGTSARSRFYLSLPVASRALLTRINIVAPTVFVGSDLGREKERKRFERNELNRTRWDWAVGNIRSFRILEDSVVLLPRWIFVRNICRCFSRDTLRVSKGKMCVKPMEENEEDKVVSMIINYFTARVNIMWIKCFFQKAKVFWEKRRSLWSSIVDRSMESWRMVKIF